MNEVTQTAVWHYYLDWLSIHLTDITDAFLVRAELSAIAD